MLVHRDVAELETRLGAPCVGSRRLDRERLVHEACNDMVALLDHSVNLSVAVELGHVRTPPLYIVSHHYKYVK